MGFFLTIYPTGQIKFAIAKKLWKVKPTKIYFQQVLVALKQYRRSFKLVHYWSPQTGFIPAISRLQVQRLQVQRSTTDLLNLYVQAQNILRSFAKHKICENWEKTIPSRIFMPCNFKFLEFLYGMWYRIKLFRAKFAK